MLFFNLIALLDDLSEKKKVIYYLVVLVILFSGHLFIGNKQLDFL
jgi:hypothetical protein